MLSTPILSFLLPLVKIPTFKKAVPQEFIIYLPEIVLSPQKVIQEASWYQSINYIDVFLGIGFIVFSIFFIAKLLQIIHLIKTHKLIKKEGFTLVIIANKTKAFSFFNYIFLGEEIPETQRPQIIAHELVHSKQKHSLDLLFFEFLKIAMWFNPIIFLYQKRIRLLHEYISDEVATKLLPKENYINHLLSNFFQVENIAFINQFYKQTFIKKRIIMITKKQSNKINQLKYLLLIPVLISMLFYTSCSDSPEIIENETLENLSSDLEVERLLRENQLLKDSLIKIKKQVEIRSNLKRFSKNNMLENYKNFTNKEEISFMKIDKAPTFPGCESGDKNCFSKMVQKHFSKNFDAKLPNQLNLSSGRKRIFIMFKIDKDGNVVEVKARAPHEKIKEEVLRVMQSLPKMIPGEQDGKPVAVKYSIPFVIAVEGNNKN
ncbi:M56 family metallopeptidase [Polaribacter batillariae]|uniref:M56 family metallopeptidase n=1 Tax=Polaribacter batillariae TaxID=2808900 RepID=UPI001FB10077|nr:M56 family metallopeptidase [Polaribacter batillariae]